MIVLAYKGRGRFNHDIENSLHVMYCGAVDYRELYEKDSDFSIPEKFLYQDWRNPILRYWKYKQHNIWTH
jgi:hypothetical protein